MSFFYTDEVARVKGQNVGTVSTEECLPPAQVFATDEIPTLLEPLFPANAEPKVCLFVSFVIVENSLLLIMVKSLCF